MSQPRRLPDPLALALTAGGPRFHAGAERGNREQRNVGPELPASVDGSAPRSDCRLRNRVNLSLHWFLTGEGIPWCRLVMEDPTHSDALLFCPVLLPETRGDIRE